MGREVIRVETTGTDGQPVTVEATGASFEDLARLADEVLPPLVARLGVSGLGEIEVRHDDWRVRLRRSAPAGRPARAAGASSGPGAHASGPGAHASGPGAHASGPGAPAPAGPASGPASAIAMGVVQASTTEPTASSPAVGYLSFRADVVVGHRVARGDALGWVDVLGVRQEVVAPVDGVIGELLVTPGDPVEYGQALVRLLAADAPASTRVAD